MKNILVVITVFLATNLNAQFVMFNNSHNDLANKVELRITVDNSLYQLGDTIWINYQFINVSDPIQKVLIRETLWKHPMGITV